jgi:hypothetical protein
MKVLVVICTWYVYINNHFVYIVVLMHFCLDRPSGLVMNH